MTDFENNNTSQDGMEQNQNNTNQNNTNQNNTNQNQNNPYQNNNIQNQNSQNQNSQNLTNNNLNQDNTYLNQDNIYQNQNNTYQNQNQNQFNKMQEYSFWAEQTPNTTYSNYNQAPAPNTNAWGYNNNNANNYYGEPNNENNKKEKKSSGKGKKVVVFITKAVCFGLIAGIGFLGFQKIYSIIDPNATSNTIIDQVISDAAGTDSYEIGFTEPGTVKVVEESVVSEVTNNTLSAIVSINSVSTQSTDWFGENFEVQGSGSGIIVGKNDKELLVATNNHVVEGTDTITVTFADGTEADAKIKGTDVTADLAVVTVDITKLKQTTLDAITVAKLGNSDEVKVGEMVIAIGNALGYGQSVTVGYISAKDREVQVSDGYDTKNMVLLQTDAAINPGNSGGALLNVDGEVIGINTVKYASDEVEGMGYAIPISRATPIITELMNRIVLSEEEKGYLGIAGNDVTEEIASYYNMPVGVFINEVSKDGAAEKAGLQAGDIITGADDIDITSITQLREYVNSRKVGTQVEITYSRDANGKYEEGKVTVTLSKNPNLTAAE